MDASNNNKQVWPPAPTVPSGGAQASSPRLYFTTTKALDTVVGIVSGLVFQWFASYGLCTGLYYLLRFWYHVSKPPDMWYDMFGCALVLICSILIWSRLRMVYKTFANSVLWASLLFGSLLLWFSYELASDTGPPILPR